MTILQSFITGSVQQTQKNKRYVRVAGQIVKWLNLGVLRNKKLWEKSYDCNGTQLSIQSPVQE